MQTPFELPVSSPAVPQQLNGSAKIKFRCHKDVTCYNECCRQADIPLTSYDVIRLKGHLGISSTEFLKEYTFPFEMDNDRLPGIKLLHQEGTTTCQFMNDEGCGV
ncbi:MAG TPA: YkgJ family cysteine cluster protein, partial [Gammaproteobacteria bacterium]|nr:YkgJ family cysteine cluster protein [Gammaproteobacteria bacterium]